MKSPGTLLRRIFNFQFSIFKFGKGAGVSIIEVLVAIGILIVLISLGLFLSMDFYRTYSFHSDKDLVISILQKARNRAVSNINQSSYSVYYDDTKKELVIFEGSVYVPNDPSNENIPIERLGITWPGIINFEQLTGNVAAAPLEITLISVGKPSLTITIKEQGRINY